MNTADASTCSDFVACGTGGIAHELGRALERARTRAEGTGVSKLGCVASNVREGHYSGCEAAPSSGDTSCNKREAPIGQLEGSKDDLAQTSSGRTIGPSCVALRNGTGGTSIGEERIADCGPSVFTGSGSQADRVHKTVDEITGSIACLLDLQTEQLRKLINQDSFVSTAQADDCKHFVRAQFEPGAFEDALNAMTCAFGARIFDGLEWHFGRLRDQLEKHVAGIDYEGTGGSPGTGFDVPSSGGKGFDSKDGLDALGESIAGCLRCQDHDGFSAPPQAGLATECSGSEFVEPHGGGASSGGILAESLHLQDSARYAIFTPPSDSQARGVDGTGSDPPSCSCTDDGSTSDMPPLEANVYAAFDLCLAQRTRRLVVHRPCSLITAIPLLLEAVVHRMELAFWHRSCSTGSTRAILVSARGSPDVTRAIMAGETVRLWSSQLAIQRMAHWR